MELNTEDILSSIRDLLTSALKSQEVQAVLVPLHFPQKQFVMPALVTDPEKLTAADPLLPCFPLNTARMLSRLTRKTIGSKIAALMRPCEIRAFYELVKFNQGSLDELIIIGIDCLGAYHNAEYLRFIQQYGSEALQMFYKSQLESTAGEFRLSEACMMCEHPIPEKADICIEIFGNIKPGTQQGQDFLSKIGLKSEQKSDNRHDFMSSLVKNRIKAGKEILAAVHENTNSLEKLTAYLADCVNCYNCRVACPVCYCRECVFVTEAFDHEPYQYLNRAQHLGMIKMPSDTLFYHLTRLTHISTSCVGCGQCSNACPNNIPLTAIFKLTGSKTQAAFDYIPGRNIDEKPPLSVFGEHEFSEIVGII